LAGGAVLFDFGGGLVGLVPSVPVAFVPLFFGAGLVPLFDGAGLVPLFGGAGLGSYF